MASVGLRVVEFYAGAGGFHYSLLEAAIPFTVVASIDINTNTNQVYRFNFPRAPHWNRNICGLSAQELDDLSPDVFVLSPPCQPFTRQGQRRDHLDSRTDSFFHLMGLLGEMTHPPSYILMENVQGFEASHTRGQFTEVLSAGGYEYQEFLLSPTQFGVPNSRLRYYLLAKRKPLSFAMPHLHSERGIPCKDPSPLLQFIESLKPQDVTTKTPLHSIEPNETKPISSGAVPNPTLSTPNPDSISAHLEELSDERTSEYLVPDKVLLKYAVAMDIIRPSDSRSCCFTRAYGHYAVGTGSVLQHCLEREEMDLAFEQYSRDVDRQKRGEQCDPVSHLRPLKLRYFTPREVANLMCFPATFSFPATLTNTQCYKVLGNSLNIRVVSVLIKYLFSPQH